jgi:4-nitrophenyl phosphatase
MQQTNTGLNFASIQGVVLDMDGVTWAGSQILPGVPDFFLFLRTRQIPYVLATNNSSKNVAEYVARLDGLGVPIGANNIVTSGTVTAEALARQYPAGTAMYVIGSESLSQLLTSFGYEIDPVRAKVVVVGLDTTLTYEKLQIAGQRILAGADFIGTNGDLTLPTPGGLAPGNGSVLAALQAMTGCVPRLMGKPEPIMFEVALERLGTKSTNTLMVGDRLDTDILGAQRAGLLTAMVLTGVSTREDVATLPPNEMPNSVFVSLAALLEAWQKSVIG